MKDSFVYRSEDMNSYGIDFLAKIDPVYTQDLTINMDWYQENYNEMLLNVSIPSKLEKDFLKHIE